LNYFQVANQQIDFSKSSSLLLRELHVVVKWSLYRIESQLHAKVDLTDCPGRISGADDRL